MQKTLSLVIFVLLVVATIVAIDVLFFRHRLLQRLVVNVAIVLVFITLYVLFQKRA